MQSYHIDLLTILRILSQQSGELHALVKNVPGIKEVCYAQVVIVRGKVTTCSLEGKNSRYLYFNGEAAVQKLQKLGELDWTYTPNLVAPSRQSSRPQSALSSGGQPAVNTYSLHPYRTRKVDAEEFLSWSYLQRAIYNAIDGSRSIEEIARALSTSYEHIQEILFALYSVGVIAFRP